VTDDTKAAAGDPIGDPIGVITALVAAVEHSLTGEQIESVVTAAAGGRAKQRRLAAALSGNSQVLTSGRPPAPRMVGQLLLELRKDGAAQIAAPRCGSCDKPVSYMLSSGGTGWECSTCQASPQVCAGCGRLRQMVTRDRGGHPRCRACPDTAGDPLAALAGLVAGLDPAMGSGQVMAMVEGVVAAASGQRRLAWAVLDNPALLTGGGADAPTPMVLAFIDALVTAGTAGVVRPACPRCGRQVRLSKVAGGKRVCRACDARARAVPCGRCGAVQQVAARDSDGDPLCPSCLVRDPANLEDCAGCGRRSHVVVRTASGPLCANCRPSWQAICAICGRAGACELSEATGQPWCRRCQKWWTRCSGCGSTAPVRGGSRRAPLCVRCVNPDPAFWDRCPTCKTTWQLSTVSCQRCALQDRAAAMLGGRTGTIRADLVPLQHALGAAGRPGAAMAWLASAKVTAILTRLAGDDRVLTHEILDELPPGKTLAHLRSILVATGVVPPRDERLTGLQQWISDVIAARTDPAERQVLRQYAVWHHLRRLRNRIGEAPVSQQQVLNLRTHLIAAITYMDHLAGLGLTLASCTQADLDRWIAASAPGYRDQTSHFIRWSVEHRRAGALTFPARRWQGPTGPHDTEQRWADARRLLHDDTLATADRVAGLLILLYAQKIAVITRLTTDHVQLDDATVTLALGKVPIVLPEPLASLVLAIAAGPRGRAAITATIDSMPWLFPGIRPGQPISDSALAHRLQLIGLHPRQDRSTALFALAAELPAAILARMLGINVHVAVAWQHAASGDWMAYAADIAHRDDQPSARPPTSGNEN